MLAEAKKNSKQFFKMKIIRSDALYTTAWSGGKTTQLFIYPENASYADRNFGFRISSASVETPASDFTPLPDYNRILMLLDGAIELIHENHYQKNLKAFDQDHFHGSWVSRSKGTCIDFNIIFNSSFDAQCECIHAEKGKTFDFFVPNKFVFLYLWKGIINLEGSTLSKGDLIVLNNEVDDSVHFICLDNTIIIKSIVDHKS